MASRHNHEAESLQVSEESEDCSVDEEIISEEANNRRLRQAISYIATEGGSDPLALYAHRIQKIDEQILQQYAEEGYSFDPHLYRRLKAMTREVQTDFVQDLEDSEVLDDSDDMDEAGPDALYREPELNLNDDELAEYDDHIPPDDLATDLLEDYPLHDQALGEGWEKDGPAEPERYRKYGVSEKLDELAAEIFEGADNDSYYDPQLAAEKRAGKAPVRQSKSPSLTRSARQATPSPEPVHHDHPVRPIQRPRPAPLPSMPSPSVPGKAPIAREIQWRYGGPKNELEEYHKNFPAVLPFGETLYMQAWESMKIDYDLRESMKRKPEDPPIVTNVGYDEVKLPRSKNIYDSGSRFTLPALDDSLVKWFDVGGDELLHGAVEKFNQGGSEGDQLKKDYAPRIFLPKVRPDVNRRSPSFSRSRPSSKNSVQHRSSSSRADNGGSANNSQAERSSSSGNSDFIFLPPIHNADDKLGQRRPSVASISTNDDNRRHSVGQFTGENRNVSKQDGIDTINAEIRRQTSKSKVPSSHLDITNPKPRYALRSAVSSRRPDPALPLTKRHPVVEPTPAVKRGPGRPRKKSSHLPPVSSSSRPQKRKLSDGSKKFVPLKKRGGKAVTFEEDLEWSDEAHERLVKKWVAKKRALEVKEARKKAPKPTETAEKKKRAKRRPSITPRPSPRSPRHTRSGTRLYRID